jgi:hypothetical protein
MAITKKELVGNGMRRLLLEAGRSPRSPPIRDYPQGWVLNHPKDILAICIKRA